MLNIQYDDLGRREGEPALLFIPAFCESRSIFNEMVRLATSHHRVLNMDLPFHSIPSNPPSPHTQSEKSITNKQTESAQEDMANRIDTRELKFELIVKHAIEIICQSEAKQVIPVMHCEAGFIGIELRRKLGAHQIPALIFLDWTLAEPSHAYMGIIKRLQIPEETESARNQLIDSWKSKVKNEEVCRRVEEMRSRYSADIWRSSAHEIDALYERHGSPLRALLELDAPPPKCLHIFAQPHSPVYAERQKAFAVVNTWYRVEYLEACKSHLPMLEDPLKVWTLCHDFLLKVVPGAL